jgi:hypothetical protein
MPTRYPRRLLEPYDPIFDAKEATRCVRESLEQLARFRSRVMESIASIQATVETEKLIAAAKAVRDKPL